MKKKTDIPFPGYFESISIYLSDVMPFLFFNRYGTRGILTASLHFYLIGKRIFKFIFYFLKFSYRILYSIKKILKWSYHQLKSLRVPDRGEILRVNDRTMIFSDRLILTNVEYIENSLEFEVMVIKKIYGDYLFFVHFIPAFKTFFTKNGENNDFFSFDFRPKRPFSSWSKNITYKENCKIYGLESGYYRIEIGIYNSFDFSRLELDGSDKNCFDLGWVFVHNSFGDE
jgi:hypothetical protein